MIQQSMEESDEEIPYVDNQQMLTTDQIYQMMRGNLPDEKSRVDVPPPFADVKDVTPVVQQSQKPGGSANKASSHTSEKPPADDSWRKWDEG